MAYFSVEGRLTVGGFSKIKLCSERFVRCDADVPGVIRDQDDERTPETSNSFILCCTLVTLKSNVFLCVCVLQHLRQACLENSNAALFANLFLHGKSREINSFILCYTLVT